jgi:ArsR family transcriptional regulator
MALADKTRLKILSLLKDGEVCVNDFTEAIKVSQPKISRHLAYLRSSGLVKTRRDGKWVYYSIDPELQSSAKNILTCILDTLEETSQPVVKTNLAIYKSVKPDMISDARSAGKRRLIHQSETKQAPEIRSDALSEISQSHNEIEDFLL